MQVNKTLINTTTLCYIIFSIGIVASLALIIAAVVAVAYMLALAMTELCQLASTISDLYHHADSFTQLIVLCLLAFLTYKLVRTFVIMVHKEAQAW